MRIALLAGGDSPEREVSLGSAAQVSAALSREKFDVHVVDVRGAEWTCEGSRIDLNDFSLKGKRFDYALIMIHGTPGEDGRVQGYLDIVGVPYSGCGMVSSVITFDKQLCKRMVEAAGVATAREVFLRRNEVFSAEKIVAELGLPLFVKPNASGSSFGVTKVKRIEDVAAAIAAAFKESDSVLIEEMLAGREVACGLMEIHGTAVGTSDAGAASTSASASALGNDGMTIFPLTEIVSKNEFFDYKAKYTAGFSDEITPAALDETVAAKVREAAAKAYRACRCRGLVRIDFMVSDAGRPVMIEVNSIPGMSAGSIVPKQAASIGLPLGELFESLIGSRLVK